MLTAAKDLSDIKTLEKEIMDFVASLTSSNVPAMTITQLERNGQIQREMMAVEKKNKRTWGSKKNLFNMGKKPEDMEWFPVPKKIYTPNSQIKSWHGYNEIREDRRLPWVVTAKKQLKPKRISLFDLEKMLTKNPNRKYEKKEVYSLSFDINSITDQDVRTFIDDNTMFGGSEPFENYQTFITNGTEKHKEIAEKYGKINTYYEHYINSIDMHHEFETYANSIKYTTKKYKGFKSIYLGTACSIKRSRRTEYVLEIAHCFTELDHYKVDKYKHLTAKELFPLVLEKLDEEGFPRPTDVSFSQGLQLLWKISPIGSYRRSSWIIVQRKIHQILEEFGADSAVVSDTVRLLRLAGTIHEKTGEKIVALNYTNDRYDFETLMQRTCPEEYEDLLKRREYAVNKQKGIVEKGLKVIEGGKSPVPYLDAKPDDKYKISGEHRRFNIIHGKRLFDLLLLIQMRQGEMIGMREIACFLARYWYLCMTGNKTKAINKMKDVFFSMEMYGTYEFEEMLTLTKSAETAWERWVKDYNRGYNYSQKRLVELLNITPEEMLQLKHIMTEEEANRRQREYDRERDKERDKDKERNTRKNRKKGHQDKEELKRIKFEAVKSVLDENSKTTNKEIHAILKGKMKISQRTVDTYARMVREQIAFEG